MSTWLAFGRKKLLIKVQFKVEFNMKNAKLMYLCLREQMAWQSLYTTEAV